MRCSIKCCRVARFDVDGGLYDLLSMVRHRVRWRMIGMWFNVNQHLLRGSGLHCLNCETARSAHQLPVWLIRRIGLQEKIASPAMGLDGVSSRWHARSDLFKCS
jgi:hypothetical protein